MQQESILIDDDEPLNLQVLSQLFTPQYQLKVCKSGKDALRILSDAPLPGLILLDIRSFHWSLKKASVLTGR